MNAAGFPAANFYVLSVLLHAVLNRGVFLSSPVILFSHKKQTLFMGKTPLNASSFCAKSAEYVSCRLRRVDAL